MAGLTFHWYGFFIAAGVLAGFTASEWLSRRRGFRKDLVWDGLWWVLVPAVVGARLYHVLDRWGDFYAVQPLQAFFIWEGGLGIWGGVLGGVLGVWGFWKFRLSTIYYPLSTLLDVVFFGLPIGQAIGRLGNWVNQEVYGLPTSLPWGIMIDNAHRFPGFETFQKFHPLFAYEALLSLLGFLVMIFVELKYSKNINKVSESKLINYVHNSYSGFYLVWYGLVRFSLDFLRLPEFIWRYPVGPYSLNMAQVFSLGAVVLGVTLLRRPRHRPVLQSRQSASGQTIRST